MRTLGFIFFALFATHLLAQDKPAEKFQNPVDGRTYIAPGGWQSYKPQGGTAQPLPGRIRLAGVRLLSSQSEFDANISAQVLADFIQKIEAQAAQVFVSSKTGAVMVQVNSAPQRQDIKLASQGDIDRALMQKFYEDLVKMDRLKVKVSEIAFLVQISIAP